MSNNKLQKLLEDLRTLYHTQDLKVLWNIENKDTLYMTVKRYVDKGVLHRVHKGLYSTVSPDTIDPVFLGLSALHKYGYLSTESVLVKEGIIFQNIQYITLISSRSGKMNLAGKKFLVRQMKDEFLHNRAGIQEDSGLRVASVERAVADMLYFNPNYHFDAGKKINWQKVKEIQKTIGY